MFAVSRNERVIGSLNLLFCVRQSNGFFGDLLAASEALFFFKSGRSSRMSEDRAALREAMLSDLRPSPNVDILLSDLKE